MFFRFKFNAVKSNFYIYFCFFTTNFTYMKTKLLLLMLLGLVIFPKTNAQTTTTNIFNQVLFYDGYASLVGNSPPAGVTRFRNDLISRQLTDAELSAFGSTLAINVTVKAACDNYDRIGNVNMALVPKGSSTYVPENVTHIELARFITPFMDYNVSPDTVPYTFSADNVAKLFKDSTLLATYDIWIELQIFGVPYAANTQIVGCDGRNDVFYGTLDFVSDATPITANEVLIPLNFQNYLNNYQAGASDAIGTTTRTISFNTPNDINNAAFYLITSNHGSNSGGEEYNRRWHYIDFDNVQKLSYKPGETTCEPYRIYNTQANGIYGSTPRTNAQWQSFSNWCPGSKIPIRTVNLGNITAGTHSFRIRVPTAVFTGQQGYFPVSVYLQGTNGSLTTSQYSKVDYFLTPNPTSNFITINTNDTLERVIIVDIQGKEIWRGVSKNIDLSNFQKGMYFMKLKFENFDELTEKIIKD